MENFEKNIIKIKESVKISDFLGHGATFEIDTAEDGSSYDYSKEIDFSTFEGSEDHLNPLDTPFKELKLKMVELVKDVWKKVYKEAPKNATSIDLSRHRVTYHRNMYMEEEVHPFDSTWLNGKPHIINPYETERYLEGILDALSTMKEGEQSYFIISYRKMFKEKGCEPRVLPRADIFCDLKVIKIEEIGDEININQLNKSVLQKTFDDVKIVYNDGRLRAKNYFENKKIESAMRIYERITQMFEMWEPETDDEKRELVDMMVQNYTNLGLCYNLTNQPKRTIQAISQIEYLTNNETNVKVLFIKGRALRLLGKFNASFDALTKAYKLSPMNIVIGKELQKLNEAKANNDLIVRKLAQNLFVQY